MVCIRGPPGLSQMVPFFLNFMEAPPESEPHGAMLYVRVPEATPPAITMVCTALHVLYSMHSVFDWVKL